MYIHSPLPENPLRGEAPIRVVLRGAVVEMSPRPIRVKAVFLQEFYRLIGSHEIEVELEEGATIADLVDYIDSKIKPGFREMVLEGNRVKYPVEIAVNGRRIEVEGGLERRLRDGDRVLFSPRALFVV